MERGKDTKRERRSNENVKNDEINRERGDGVKEKPGTGERPQKAGKLGFYLLCLQQARKVSGPPKTH